MNQKIIIEELDFFSENQSLIIMNFNNCLENTTLDLVNNSFKNVSIFTKPSEIKDLNGFDYDILLMTADDLNVENFEILKEIKITKKQVSIVVVLKNFSKMIERLVDINIDSLLLSKYSQNDILRKLLLLSENNYMKNSLNELHEEMYLYHLKKDLKAASKSIKNIETQKALEVKTATQKNDEELNNYIENFNQDHLIDDSLWNHISYEITTLNEIYEENINKIVLSGFDEQIKYELTDLFLKYYNCLQLIPGLEDFTEIFSDLSISLSRLNLDNLDSQSMEVFDMFEYLYDDITKFFNTVMIEKQTKNLNYLTDSMKSSVLQIKIKLGLVEFEEDELELF